jgi:hypothetical protein
MQYIIFGLKQMKDAMTTSISIWWQTPLNVKTYLARQF